jgi:hypothetical protein
MGKELNDTIRIGQWSLRMEDKTYTIFSLSRSRRDKVTRLLRNMIYLLILSFLAGCGKEGGGLKDMIDTAASGGAAVIELNPAEVLPDSPSTLFGIVDHCQDNSIFVTQLPSLDQITATGTAKKGPIVEIVVVNDTLIYKDVTSGEVENGAVQEKVALGSVDEIGAGNLISVWGEQRGDRIVADVVKYNTHSQLVLPSGPVN